MGSEINNAYVGLTIIAFLLLLIVFILVIVCLTRPKDDKDGSNSSGGSDSSNGSDSSDTSGSITDPIGSNYITQIDEVFIIPIVTSVTLDVSPVGIPYYTQGTITYIKEKTTGIVHTFYTRQDEKQISLPSTGDRISYLQVVIPDQPIRGNGDFVYKPYYVPALFEPKNIQSQPLWINATIVQPNLAPTINNLPKPSPAVATIMADSTIQLRPASNYGNYAYNAVGYDKFIDQPVDTYLQLLNFSGIWGTK